MDNTDKLIKEQFESLPLEIKEALGRVPWQARIKDIAKREGLNDEKAAALETETMLILYGFLAAEHYKDNILTEVGVDEEQAERIEKLAKDEIFADIEKQYEMIEALAPKVDDKKPKLDIPPEIMAKQIKMPEEPIAPTPVESVPALPEIAPENLPMVEPGETAHAVPHAETPAPTPMSAPIAKPASTPAFTPVSTPKNIVEEKLSQATVATNEPPKSSYGGKDPYREPIE